MSLHHKLNESPFQGTVFKKTLGSYWVKTSDRVVSCSISSKLRKELVFPTANPNSVRSRVVAVEDIHLVDPVAVGDAVQFVEAGEGAGLITAVLPRRNQLVRRAAGKKPLTQVIVSNVDQIIPVFSADRPAPKWNLLDRYLATAEWAGIPALICITKIDLPTDTELRRELEVYQSLGYRVALTSSATGEGVPEFKEALRGRVSVFVGKSGVGKSSLLNAIQPGLGLRVNEVSQSTGKGKHTTTGLEMFSLEAGGQVVDTPGMREFSLGELEGEAVDMALLFPELRSRIGACRFGVNCGHTREPGCAIRAGVEAGEISPRRYESYLRIREG